MSQHREPDAQPVEVARVAGVRQLVERHDVVVRMALEPPADEVRADEAGAAGDEDRFRHVRIVPILRGLDRERGDTLSRLGEVSERSKERDWKSRTC